MDKMYILFFMDTAIEKGFENREGQWDMSFEIVDAMKNRQHILVEAGVGIGKTFAYIVPLLYYYKRYKILVSEREKSADGTVKQEIKIYYSFHLMGDIADFPVCTPLRTADR